LSWWRVRHDGKRSDARGERVEDLFRSKMLRQCHQCLSKKSGALKSQFTRKGEKGRGHSGSTTKEKKGKNSIGGESGEKKGFKVGGREKGNNLEEFEGSLPDGKLQAEEYSRGKRVSVQSQPLMVSTRSIPGMKRWSQRTIKPGWEVQGNSILASRERYLKLANGSLATKVNLGNQCPRRQHKKIRPARPS